MQEGCVPEPGPQQASSPTVGSRLASGGQGSSEEPRTAWRPSSQLLTPTAAQRQEVLGETGHGRLSSLISFCLRMPNALVS